MLDHNLDGTTTEHFEIDPGEEHQPPPSDAPPPALH
jgi:hypothetical protein